MLYIYEYDKDWLKTVLNLTCPECLTKMVHKGIKRQCPNNDLTVYGNPILLAYTEKTLTKPRITKHKSGICPECFKEGKTYNNVLHDPKHAQRVCGECGLVLSGPPQCGVEYPWGNDYDDQELFQ